jgi:hypothetical protein
LASEASLLAWDACRSNLSGAAWFINRGENKSTGDPWTVLGCQQPVFSPGLA